MKLAVQLRCWLVTGVSLSDALASARNAGYTAAEMGVQFVGDRSGAALARELGDHGIELAALHVSPDWAGATQAALEDVCRRAGELVAAAGGQYLLTSTRPELSAGPGVFDTARRVGERLGKVRRALETDGVVLCLHNHAWEFESEGVFDLVSQDLRLAVDLAHLWRAGQDVDADLAAWGDRVVYLHVRDAVGGHWAPEVGTGGLPLLRWIHAVRSHVDWATVELELDPRHEDLGAAWSDDWDTYALNSRRYLETQLGLASGGGLA